MEESGESVHPVINNEIDSMEDEESDLEITEEETLGEEENESFGVKVLL